jgi:nucleoside-diphosphate-sugar epimerase
MQTQDKPLHVVLGAGQIGSLLAQQLAARGERVRIVRRSSAATPAGVEARSGDIRDVSFAADAASGAAVVYDCMNPSYDKWDEQLLALARGSLHAATANGAKLVALDCLYMYGRPDGKMREDSPRKPCSHKGELRVALEQLRMSAHRRGEVKVAIARASDFFGAGLQQSAFSDRFFERAFAGKAVECLGDPDAPHSYTYARDVVTALSTLGARSEADGQVWHVATSSNDSTRALYDRVGHALGLGDLKIMRVPKLLVRGLGLFNPIMREMVEMMYQWEVPYLIDDTKFRATFAIEPTPVEQAAAEVAAWARSHYARQAA